MHLVAASNIAAMTELVRKGQANGILPKRGSGAKTEVFPAGPTMTAFVTESNTTPNPDPNPGNLNPTQRRRREPFCDACKTQHICGDFHCPLRCTHCQKPGHSGAMCGTRKSDRAFKRKQRAKLKNALVTQFFRDQERQIGEGQRDGRLPQDVGQLDLAQSSRLEEQTRINQVLINHDYHTRGPGRQEGRVRRDRRGSFSDLKEENCNDWSGRSQEASTGGFPGVFTTKFRQDPER